MQHHEITLETTTQDIFDEAIRYFQNAKGRCMDRLGCAYRSPDGQQACVAGHFMSDEEVRRLGRNSLSADRVVDHGFIVPLDHPEKAEIKRLLTHLQRVHDWVGNWKVSGFTAWDKLKDLAEGLKLTYSGPTP